MSHISGNAECGVLTVTRNVISVQSSYHLINDDHTSTSLIKKLAVQRDLGVLITGDFKWSKQVNAVYTKANRMLGFIRRTSADMRDPRIRTALYKTLVRSHFVYSSQFWSPQSVALILDLEKVQRHATRFILSLSFQSETKLQRSAAINRVASFVLLARVPGFGIFLQSSEVK